MYKYVFRRVYQLIIVFFLFLVTSYVLFDSIPGNAFQSLLLNPELPREAYDMVIQLYGLDKPLYERVILYIQNFFRGDFGYSYVHYPRTPIELIAERLPRTLMLFAMVNIVAFYTGFLIGKILAWRRGSKSETWITVTSVFSYTVFYPWFALMMLWFFGYKLDWLPIGKFLYPEKWYDSPYDSDVIFVSMIKFIAVASILQMLAFVYTRNIESISARRNVRFTSFMIIIIGSFMYWNTGEMLNQKIYAMDIAYHMILPVFTVTVVAFAGTALLTRTTMMEVMKDDFILTARAKGISQKRIRDRHAARNALLPVVTSFIFTIVTIIDGSVLTETIFSWPGMGQLILDSVLREDIPVAMASFSFIGVFALIAHFIADISYAYLDPRIRIQSQG
ncbi:MAG: ABC transporter permease [Candidatus Actinomarina sp.]|tara:strand:- start:231 stop:1403 length:1173 start_codon:yes stop_codon:yes gene_type:complete